MQKANPQLKIKNYNIRLAKKFLVLPCRFSFLNFNFEFRGGFTLVETLVALSVLLAAVVGPVALVSRGIINTYSIKNRLIALNLAQEGIELVRLVRENNVLCDGLNGATVWEWDEDVSAPNPTPGSPNPRNNINTSGGADSLRVDILNFSPSGPELNSMNCKANATDPDIIIQTPNTPHDSSLPALKFETNITSPNFGLYQYQTGDNTTFTRTLKVRSPPTGGPDLGIEPRHQMDITSTVTWTDRGGPKSIILQERLFDWR